MSATEHVPGLRPIRGPSALGGDARRFVNLLLTLATTDFKLRFFGSTLGYLWQLVRPLMLFGVLFVVFTQFVRLGTGVPFYPVVLLMGIVLYSFFAEATGGSVTSVIDRENLVRKIHFPRMVIPLSVTLTASFNLLLSLVVVFFFMAASGVEVRLTWLELPVLIVLLTLFAAGLAMLLSALFVSFRDVRPIWDVITQALFYATPVIYPIEQVAARNETLAQIAMCNPLAAIIQQFRYAMIDPSAQSAGEALGGAWMLLVPVAVIVAVFALGLWVFDHMAPRIADEL